MSQPRARVEFDGFRNSQGGRVLDEHERAGTWTIRTRSLSRRRVAEERAAELRAAWRKEGSPVTTLGGATGRVVVAHPMLEAVERAERHGSRLRELVRKRYRGPEPRGRLGVGLSKSAKLRPAASRHDGAS